ncbi:MAG: Gfo/Idh/MocA family oxidoreductase [Betaproteobacteria bacterium]|nr:Gfo/Idh/MocA family oxidoreductase [Betaproteobacteria bacterium]MDH3437335.1 Gfo/Idh/MocA family oxidoreductase [Betaproteobacteria bacterium]
METKKLGVGVIGSGRIGSLRAKMAAGHPAVRFLAVADLEVERAKRLADSTGAQFHSDNNWDLISHPDVNTVVVATFEHDHAEAVCQALELGKPVLCEKPIALSLEDADRIIDKAEETGTPLRIGYAQRFKRRYLSGKDQITAGRLGNVLAFTARACNTRAQGIEILKRSPNATPVVDVLTYWVDVAGWYLEGIKPVEVTARGTGVVFREAGFDVNDTTWALVTFENGAVANLGVFFALPTHAPQLGMGVRIEVYGSEGALLLNDDHFDEFLVTNKGIPHAYIPDLEFQTALLSSSTPGNWHLDDYWGPVADESRVWFDHLSRGRPCPMATPREARQTLEITLAIEESARTGQPVWLRN